MGNLRFSLSLILKIKRRKKMCVDEEKKWVSFLARFLVACYAISQVTLSVHSSVGSTVQESVGLLHVFFWSRARDSTTRFVCRSVGRLVGWSVTLYFFYDFISLASLLLPKWSGDLKMAPAHPRATSVAVYPALFCFFLFVLFFFVLFCLF